MNNRPIIDELKDLNLSLKKIKDGDNDKLVNRCNQVKIYILGLLLNKEDKDLKKEIINRLEECIKGISTHMVSKNKKETNEQFNKIKHELKELLEQTIKVLEIREEGSGETKLGRIHIVCPSIERSNIEEAIQDTLIEIENSNKTKKEKEEARQKLDKLEKELKESGFQNRNTIKSLIKRFADFSKDVFVALLPVIIHQYALGNNNKKSEQNQTF